jgi:glycosyltransferase involved in cell wall biosynthesis
MRIALATWSRRRAGGVETYVEHVGAALAAAGHEVALWHEADTPASAAPITLPPGAVSLQLTGNTTDALAWRPDALIVNGLENVELEGQLLAAVPALFVAHNFYGTCISGRKSWSMPVERPCSRQFGRACLAHYFPHRCGGLNPITMLSLYTRERRRLSQLTRARHIVTLSAFMRDEYLGHGFGEERVVCVPYGPATRQEPAAPTSRRGATPEAIVFVGRLERMKGVHVLLEALPIAVRALDRQVSLTIVGDGPERARLEALAAAIHVAESRVAVHFEGWLAPAVRDRHLASADLLAVPSVWPEPLGLVGLEAGRLGLPAVAFDVGGIRQWLTDGENGRLAPGDPPTASGLAVAIATSLADPERLDRMREHAAERARAAPTPKDHARTLVQLLSPVMSENHVPANG